MIFVLLGLLVAGTDGVAATTPNTEALVQEIKQKFKDVNAQQSRLQKTERVLLNMSTEGASITAFSEQDVIKKIVVNALGETGKWPSEYYFDNGRLFFRFDQTISYDAHIMETLSGKKLKNIVTDENRLYFAKGKLVRWLRFKKEVPSTDKEFPAMEKKALEEAANLVMLMTTPETPSGCSDWRCAEEKDERCVKYKCD